MYNNTVQVTYDLVRFCEFLEEYGLMNISHHIINKRPWLTRFRVQLISGWLIAVLIPFVTVKLGFNEALIKSNNDLNLFFGAAIAATVGVLVMRRLTNYPSIVAGSYVIISFTLSYLILVGIFFVLRLEYSRVFFVLSYVFCLVWFLLVYFNNKQRVKIVFAIVPGGNVSLVFKIAGIEWKMLKTPPEYSPDMGPVVVDLRHSHGSEWERFIAECALKGVPVYHSKQVTEHMTGKVDIEHLSENTFGSLIPNLVYQRLKLAGDVIFALILLPPVLLILAIAGLAIYFTEGQPIFFKQPRMGYQGNHFTVFKLRTMSNVIEEPSNDSIDVVQGSEDSVLQKAITNIDDIRITPLGAILRKYRIDELPQIFNIIRGEMSWIGPRPEAVVLSEWYEDKLPFYRYRHIVRPGISGWAQVNQGHVAEIEEVNEKLHYDFFYIKNLSAWLDFLIVIKTIWIVITGFGSK